MKFLSVIAASLAAFSAAQKQQQKPSSFRGSAAQKPSWGGKDQSNQQKDRWSQQKGQYGKNKGQSQQKGQYGKNKGKCSVANIPKQSQDKLATQFKALDVDGNNYLDASEFKGEEAKINEAFSSYRKGKKPSWYKGRKGRGGRGDDSQKGGRPSKGGRGDKQDGGNDTQNGGRPSRGGRGGKQDGGRGRGRGPRQLADQTKGMGDFDFMKYLQQHGFNVEKTQAQKDKEESRRAGQVFGKFDRDNNHQVSLCEYETAMYRTQLLEAKMGIKQKDDIVVVKDH